MSLDKQTSLQAMRTFARDVEREKGNSDEAKQTLANLPNTEQEAKKTKDEIAENNNAHQATPVSTGKKRAAKKSSKDTGVTEKRQTETESKTDTKQPTEPKHIPAFHELQRTRKTNIKAEPEPAKDKDRKKKKDSKPIKHVGGGTVITDNKNARKPFLSELQKSFSNWWKGLKKSLKPKKNTYEVTKTERRKGVVQKATSKTGTIFTADNETLREQIKARQRAERHEHDDLSWSPYTEPGYPLLEGEETETNDPRVVRVSVTPKTHAQPKPVIKSTEKIPELQTEQPEAVTEVPEAESPAAVPEQSKTAPPTKSVVPETETNVPDETVFEDEAEVPDESAEDVEADEKTVADWNLEDISLKDTNTLAMLIVGAFLAVGIFGFVLFGIFNLGSDDSTNVEPETPTALYTGAPLKTIPVNSLVFNDLVSALNSTLVQEPANQTVEFRFVNENGFSLPSDVVMTVLQTTSDDGFAKTVDKVRFVRTADNARAIILSTPDGVVALGGMLNWEDTLYADVGALLDIQNQAPPSAGQFVDTQFGTLDVRALTFDENTILVYARINETEVIIANDLQVLVPYSQ